MGLSPELRSALRTIGNASIGVGLGMSVLGGGFVISQFAAGQGSLPLSRSTAEATGIECHRARRDSHSDASSAINADCSPDGITVDRTDGSAANSDAVTDPEPRGDDDHRVCQRR